MKRVLQIALLAGATALFAAQDEPQQPQSQPMSDRQSMSIDARHDHGRGDCDGKLIIREDGIAFESVGEASHSRSWKYSDIEELERNRSENKIIIDSKNDDKDFTLKLQSDFDEQLYNTLKERIVAARARQ